jgi:hypothetical protein
MKARTAMKIVVLAVLLHPRDARQITIPEPKK